MASKAVAKVKDQFAAYRKAASARLAAVKSTPAAKTGRAVASGAVAGALHSYVAFDVAGRAIPLALPLGVAGALLGKGMVQDVGADMIAAGAALFTREELMRMNMAKR